MCVCACVCPRVCVRECGTGNFPLVPLSLVDKHASLLKQTVVGGEPPRARPVYGPGGAPQPKRVLDGKFRPGQIPCQYFTARLRPSCLKVRTDCSVVFGLPLSMLFDLLQLTVLLLAQPIVALVLAKLVCNQLWTTCSIARAERRDCIVLACMQHDACVEMILKW